MQEEKGRVSDKPEREQDRKSNRGRERERMINHTESRRDTKIQEEKERVSDKPEREQERKKNRGRERERESDKTDKHTRKTLDRPKLPLKCCLKSPVL